MSITRRWPKMSCFNTEPHGNSTQNTVFHKALSGLGLTTHSVCVIVYVLCVQVMSDLFWGIFKGWFITVTPEWVSILWSLSPSPLLVLNNQCILWIYIILIILLNCDGFFQSVLGAECQKPFHGEQQIPNLGENTTPTFPFKYLNQGQPSRNCWKATP